MQYCAMSCKIMPYCTAVCVTVCRVEQHCAPVCNTGQCYATWCNIVQKSIPKRSWEKLWGTQNRVQIGSGTLLGRPVASKSVPKASQERSGTSAARPGSARRVPKGAPGRQKMRPGGSGSLSRRPKSMPSQARNRKNLVFRARLVREAVSERSRTNFGRFSVSLQSLRTLESTAPASKNKGSALSGASRVVHAMQLQKSTKIHQVLRNFEQF